MDRSDTKYAFLVTASGATLAGLGAHVIGFDMDQTNQNVAAFEVYTDLPNAQFSWVVVQLLPSAEQCVGTIADLRALPAGVVPCLTVLGYHAPGDGGGGTFYWAASAAEPGNAGTIFMPASNPPMGRWKRLGAERGRDIQLRWFGAKGDPTADDGVAIVDALGAANYTEEEITRFLGSRKRVLALLDEKADAVLGTIRRDHLTTFTFSDTVVVIYRTERQSTLDDVERFYDRVKAERDSSGHS